jgi:predicted ribosome quality control (RQC) complex YloA/Tae2 family protein
LSPCSNEDGVYTDWILIRRLATELEARLRGLRLADARSVEDGRPALILRGRDEALVLDPFAETPIVVFSAQPLATGEDPGYLRTMARLLRGMRVGRVGAVRGERVMTIDLGARSRFGLGDDYLLVVELIPRFGNVVLLKDQIVVAAAKQFGPAENERRTILVGMPYAPPPPREATLPRLLREARTDDERAELLSSAEAAAERTDPLFVYRREGAIAQAHVVRLQHDPSLAESREPSLLAILHEIDERRRDRRESGLLDRRRTALRRRIERRRVTLASERTRLLARRDDYAQRERLRTAGEMLYAFAHLVPPGAAHYVPPAEPSRGIELDPTLDAKGNAAAIFARYRKLSDGAPHVARRLEQINGALAQLEELDWQLEIAEGAAISEIADSFAPAVHRRARPARRRTGLRFTLPSGARLCIGRTPLENAEVTFRIARPSDLWFHVRQFPGAHVVLQRAGGAEVDESELEAAAAAAAFHSRARDADRVAIDYVERKWVRKQRDAPEGRVWYTHARTLFVRPRDPAGYLASP